MAYRATIADVRGLINTELEDEEIGPFLSTANALVDEVVADEGYSAALMQKIEAWLAAHLVAVRDPRVSREKTGDGEVQYHGKSDMGLNATPYGQQVLILDHHGRFAGISNGKGPAEIKTII